VANLVVRNVDETVVSALKSLAGKRGTSAEAEHRRILAQALRRPKKKSFAQLLTKIPPVGKDSDFKRSQD
jgi:antitoxin FitA